MAEGSLQLPGSAVSVEPTIAAPLMPGATISLGAAGPICPVAADATVFCPPALLAVTLTMMLAPRSLLVSV